MDQHECPGQEEYKEQAGHSGSVTDDRSPSVEPIFPQVQTSPLTLELVRSTGTSCLWLGQGGTNVTLILNISDGSHSSNHAAIKQYKQGSQPQIT